MNYLKLLEILSKNKYARILTERIMAETPNFWKKVRHLAIALFLVSTAIITYGEQFGVGESILNLASYVVAIATVMGLQAQLTEDKKISIKKTEYRFGFDLDCSYGHYKRIKKDLDILKEEGWSISTGVDLTDDNFKDSDMVSLYIYK